MKQYKRAGQGGKGVASTGGARNATNQMKVQPGAGAPKHIKNAVAVCDVGGSGNYSKIKGTVSG